MSAKWVRSKKWDDQHLTGALLPVKWVLRALSSIWLSVILLTLVSLYGILASIPIGMLALIPTKLFYALTGLVVLALVCVLPTWGVLRLMRTMNRPVSSRFVTGVLMVLALGGASVVLWSRAIWPHLNYVEAVEDGRVVKHGFRFFSDFVGAYSGIPFRRLPHIEMSELEFYAWWPLSLLLVLFVVNLTVATLRRIEFGVPQIGVLTVHSGIITIALGSAYYATSKQEGDMALLAGDPDPSGKPTPGPSRTGFYDNTDSALWVTMDRGLGWEVRRIPHVPRYNDYNLAAVERGEPSPEWVRDFGPLDIPLPGPAAFGSTPRVVDAEVGLRVVGYASYAELEKQWIRREAGEGADAGATARKRTLIADATVAPDAQVPGAGETRQKVWRLMADRPAQRVDNLDLLAVEYTIGMSEERWADLGVPLRAGARHALVVEVPSKGFRGVFEVEPEQEVVVGDTGYTLRVERLEPEPPMPLVTPGYEGAKSSLAVVRVQPPVGPDGASPGAFERWVYHRFPEISQDLSLTQTNQRGMPARKAADPSIRIAYIDASQLQVYVDEQADGTARALVRFFGQAEPRSYTGLKVGDSFQAAPALKMTIGERVDGVVGVEVPVVVHPDARDRQSIGNHQAAALAVEVSEKSGARRVHWLPFTKYIEMAGETERTVTLSDGRQLTMAFGRVFHEFVPRMSLRLADFEMTPYPHSTVPRDYRSDLIVATSWGPGGDPGSRQELMRRTSLNEPLLVRTPFLGRTDLPEPVGTVVNSIGAAFSLIAPNQYKFSQAGWDQTGWRQSQAMAEAGQLPRAYARFTILGVGNNPGIYIIAAGAVMMSVGIPWAFYLKPWLVQRRKRKIQEELARAGKLPKGVAVDGGAVGADRGRA
jgi:hypothetical protein